MLPLMLRANGMIDLGVIIRDSLGGVMAACSRSLYAVHLVQDAEALALLCGAHLAIDQLGGGGWLPVAGPGGVSDGGGQRVVWWGGISHVPRDANMVQCGLAKLAISSGCHQYWLEEVPSVVGPIVLDDAKLP
ncbi:hypothetical protein Q3G72_001168 [Acer saccharum]|nr:hypothetical protein Q3G72_001168 [Acer saccharum]